MNREQIADRLIELVGYPAMLDAVEAIVREAVEAEREACAKLCENMYRRDLVQFAPEYTAADEIAQEIRARGDCATPPAAPVPEQASAAVPEGYVLVPVEPTYEMKKQGIDVEIDHDGVILCMSFEDVSRIYRAMLASQPEVRNAK